ncbi:MAG: PAS domain-containing protein [Alphaproteobacteria bacterium]|nr:PAS domain-containing protein [Alphaproteobacteria bacterium]
MVATRAASNSAADGGADSHRQGSASAQPAHLRIAGAALGLTFVPAAAALAALLASRTAEPIAYASVAGFWLVAAFFLWRHKTAIAGLTVYVERLAALAEGGEAAPPPPRWSGMGLVGRLTGAAQRLREAHDRERAAVLAQRAVNDAIVESLPDPLVIVDSDRRIVRANAAARAAFDGAVAGARIFSISRRPELAQAIDSAVAGTPARFEITVPGPVERCFAVSVVRLDPPSADGAVAAIAFQELTELKRSERQRADFVANASHELRTPLASLIGFIETLRGPARSDAEARDRFLAIMDDQAGRMARLVDGLMSLSRIEMSEHTPPSGAVDVPSLARGAAAALELKARARNMTIALRIADQVRPALADRDDLARLALNLIDNAVKYGRAGTTVTVEVATADRTGPPPPGASRVGALPAGWTQGVVTLAVRDAGEGIAIEHLPRLTERFYRVDAGRAHTAGGVGLGLAIVKHIVQRHRAVLDIESHVGVGSTFTVVLPAAPPGTPTQAEPVLVKPRGAPVEPGRRVADTARLIRA